MPIPEVAIAISIALLYPLFFRKLVAITYDEKKINDMCHTYSENNYGACLDYKEKLQTTLDTKRFIFLIVAGLVALLISYLTGSFALVLGFAIAGVLSIIWAIGGFWSHMNDQIKLSTIGIALGTLIIAPKFIGKLKNSSHQ